MLKFLVSLWSEFITATYKLSLLMTYFCMVLCIANTLYYAVVGKCEVMTFYAIVMTLCAKVNKEIQGGK